MPLILAFGHRGTGWGEEFREYKDLPVLGLMVDILTGDNCHRADGRD